MIHEEPRDRTGRSITGTQLQRRFLLFLVLGITVLFLVMIRRFVITVILAAVLAAMSRPTYLGLTRRLDGRKRTASLLTVLGLLLLVLIPLAGFLALVVGQAVEVTELAGPWLRGQS
ncbi:MAG: hypothetical protein HKO53_04030, partial [Gemmatimonadetes bacterium]|nr:hypothetical protein [Gemmatimonadota bacterium]